MIKMKITPREKPYLEQCEISFEYNNGWYPTALVHVDSFHTNPRNDLYAALNEGKTAIVTIDEGNFTVLEEE